MPSGRKTSGPPARLSGMNTFTNHLIQECPIHFECHVVHKTNVLNADLDPKIVAGPYSEGDFHRIYHGEILGVYREG